MLFLVAIWRLYLLFGIEQKGEAEKGMEKVRQGKKNRKC